MNAIVSYTKDAPILKIVLGVVVFFGGLFIFFFGAILFGLMFMVIGVNLCLLEGSEIDLNNKLYRTTKSIFGLKLGKWKPIPKFEYISVFKTSETQQVNVVSASAKFKS
jgi:hypothetical protein